MSRSCSPCPRCAAIRSAPVTTRSTSPRAMSEPAAESAMTACGMPARSSSHAVRRAPWRSGRVSSTRTRSSRPRSAGGAERADRGAVAAGREAAGVAVRQRARARLEELGGVGGHAPAAVDLFLVERARALGRRVVAHLRERPRKVDRGRPGRREHALGLVEILAAQRREREPYAAAMPIAGAPRTTIVRIASATSAAVPQRSSTTSSGSRRWSRRTTAGPSSSSRTICSGSSARAHDRYGHRAALGSGPVSCPTRRPVPADGWSLGPLVPRGEVLRLLLRELCRSRRPSSRA